MDKKLSKGIILVFITNIINLFFNLITNFAMPKFLPIETYADIKTFALYLSYAGFLHLGYEDGMYLKYGGVDREQINVKDLDINMSTLRIFQIFVGLILGIIGLVSENHVLIVFSIALIPFNMVMYFKNLYQAIGEFSEYSKTSNAITALLFTFNIFFIFAFHKEDAYPYLVIYIFVYGIVWLFLEYRLRRIYNQKFHLFRFSFNEFYLNIRSGILLMLGTFASILLTSMDRVCVKVFLNTVAFAQYSFAVSIESFLNVAITPITTTLYNYFCNVNNQKKVNKIKSYVIIFGSLLITCGYPVKYILEIWLKEYLNAIPVLFVLFAGQLFFIIVKSIYVNLYKAGKMQKLYFVKLLIVIIFGLVSNLILFIYIRKQEAFAIGTLLSAILWLILCQFDFQESRLNCREWIYIIVIGFVFVYTGIYMNSIVGFLCYVASVMLGLLIFMKKELFGLFNLGCSLIKK